MIVGWDRCLSQGPSESVEQTSAGPSAPQKLTDSFTDKSRDAGFFLTLHSNPARATPPFYVYQYLRPLQSRNRAIEFPYRGSHARCAVILA